VLFATPCLLKAFFGGIFCPEPVLSRGDTSPPLHIRSLEGMLTTPRISHSFQCLPPIDAPSPLRTREGSFSHIRLARPPPTVLSSRILFSSVPRICNYCFPSGTATPDNILDDRSRPLSQASFSFDRVHCRPGFSIAKHCSFHEIRISFSIRRVSMEFFTGAC